MGYRRRIKYKDVIDVNGPCTVFVHGKRTIEIVAKSTVKIIEMPRRDYDDHERSRLTKRRRKR